MRRRSDRNVALHQRHLPHQKALAAGQVVEDHRVVSRAGETTQAVATDIASAAGDEKMCHELP